MTFGKLGLSALVALAISSTSALAGKDHGEMFKKMDGDGDGKVTAAEHDAAGMAKFTAADANKDGMLTKGELVGFMVDEKGKSGRKAEKKSDKKMDKMDSNGDGMLTQQEFTDGHKKMFSKMDANADGSITMEEAEQGHGKMKR